MDLELMNELLIDEDNSEAVLESFLNAVNDLGRDLTERTTFHGEYKPYLYVSHLKLLTLF
jgi:hypothetical protein